MEDYKYFQNVALMQHGTTTNINTAYDASVFAVQKRPEERGPKYLMCLEIFLKCLEGGCSAAVARVAFVEAAREAGIYVEANPRPEFTGPQKLQRWGKRKTLARDRRPK
ncbi:DUF982 domain-containing protein [Phyllobacterium sp. 2063]|nr:DUF982 domain-containing protein [Phyllobacterium sp. 2063]